jgi:hypothetical protein
MTAERVVCGFQLRFVFVVWLLFDPLEWNDDKFLPHMEVLSKTLIRYLNHI